MTLLLAIYALVAIGVGATLLGRALRRPVLLPEELAIALAWAYPVGGALWFHAWWKGTTLLGFSAPWTWLTAAHFHAAGFGAWTVTALTTRLIEGRRARAVMRMLLSLHLVAFVCVAAGINGAALVAAMGAWIYAFVFAVQLVVFVGSRRKHFLPARDGLAQRAGVVLLAFSLLVPIVTMVPAVAWAMRAPVLGLSDMIAYHGIGNAVGHVVLGLIGLALLRPPALIGRIDGPFSRLYSRGTVSADFLAGRQGQSPVAPAGLVDDMTRYNRPDFDVGELHSDVRAFYERTSDFDLDVRGSWTFPFRIGGWVWARVISRALGQLGLPGPGQALEGVELDSRIVDVDDEADGRMGVRGWVRTWRKTGRSVYTAAYAEHVRAGVRYMNIAFPLPWSNLTSILHLDSLAGGGLQLTSRHDEHWKGDQGVYLSVRGRGLRLPLDETIVVYPENTSRGAQSGIRLRARHDMWLAGLGFLTLDYEIRSSQAE